MLEEVDFILCEDTRVTKKLLNKYKINNKLISFHEHSGESKINHAINLLKEGKNLALVTDAGTPGISDPGGKLVQHILDAKNFSHINRDQEKNFQIESIPGPSALTAALSISGLRADKFVFMGFPPHKKGRMTFIKKILSSEYPVVIYESKHRIIKFLEEIKNIYAKNISNSKSSEIKKYTPLKNLTSIVVLRELTKMHETIYRGEINNIITKLKQDPNAQKGEFVIIIGK